MDQIVSARAAVSRLPADGNNYPPAYCHSTKEWINEVDTERFFANTLARQNKPPLNAHSTLFQRSLATWQGFYALDENDDVEWHCTPNGSTA